MGESGGGKVRRWTDVPLYDNTIFEQAASLDIINKDDIMAMR
jgi:hypothetical protein